MMRWDVTLVGVVQEWIVAGLPCDAPAGAAAAAGQL